MTFFQYSNVYCDNPRYMHSSHVTPQSPDDERVPSRGYRGVNAAPEALPPGTTMVQHLSGGRAGGAASISYTASHEAS
ncbi:protein of unknown function [Pararobbsia alpina]